MNKKKLKEAEEKFLSDFPGGFHNPQMVEIGKKHKMDKMIALAQDSFQKERFLNIDETLENMTKIITRSSMVSVFEKPKFKDFSKGLSTDEKNILVHGLEHFLYENEELGFNMMLDILALGKMAKWSIITCWGAYYRPDFDVFCKPTTVKGVISTFELDGLIYKPQPSYAFYDLYRKKINNMKKNISSELSPNNAAFSGFLMMSMQ